MVNGAKVMTAYHLVWPAEVPAELANAKPSPLEIYYLRVEETNKPKKAIGYYARQLQVKTSEIRKTDNDKTDWLDSVRVLQQTNRRRSVDVLITRADNKARDAAKRQRRNRPDRGDSDHRNQGPGRSRIGPRTLPMLVATRQNPHRLDRHRRDGRQHVRAAAARGFRRHGVQSHAGQGRAAAGRRGTLGRQSPGRGRRRRRNVHHGRLSGRRAPGDSRSRRRVGRLQGGRRHRRHDHQRAIAWPSKSPRRRPTGRSTPSMRPSPAATSAPARAGFRS